MSDIDGAKLEARDVAIMKRIETAANCGAISALDRATAVSLLAKADAARSGVYPAAWFQNQLRDAPSNLVALFRDAA